MRLDGKVALVTGASRGIGRAIAVRLGRDGAAVVVNYSSNHKSALETVAAVEAAGGRAVAVQGDVGKVADIQRLFDAAFEHFGKLDILVNNAGVMFNKPVADVTEEEFDQIFVVNDRHDAADLWHLRRHQRSGGADVARPGEGVGSEGHHGQRRLAGTDRYGTVWAGQDRARHTAIRPVGSTGETGAAGGHRRRGGSAGQR